MIQINRRHVLTGALVAATAAVRFSSLFSVIIPRSVLAQGKTETAVIEEWMEQWMSGSRLPQGALHVGRFKDPIYFLIQPIAWKPNPDQAASFQAVEVPIGFVTDFASIPRIFWSLLR